MSPCSDAVSLVIKDGDKFVADDLALGLWIGDPLELGEEARAGIDGHEVKPQLLAKVFLHLEELVLAQNPVVDEDAGQPVAYRAMDENGRNGRVDPAGERADGMAITDFFADCMHRGLDEVLRRPVRLGVADLEDKVPQQRGSLLVWWTSG